MRRGLCAWAGLWGVGCMLGLWVWVMGYGLWVWEMGFGNGLRVVGLGNGLWVVGYGLRAWDLGYGLAIWAWVLGCRHGNGHGCAATRPKWRIDWRMKILGHQICLRVRHYHLSIRNGSLLARHCHILQLALWSCTHAPFNCFFFSWKHWRNVIDMTGVRASATCLCHPRAPVPLT